MHLEVCILEIIFNEEMIKNETPMGFDAQLQAL